MDSQQLALNSDELLATRCFAYFTFRDSFAIAANCGNISRDNYYLFIPVPWQG